MTVAASRMVGLALLTCGLAGGCASLSPAAPDWDPAASFVAHPVHEGFAIDRMPEGTGVVEPARWFSLGRAPEFRVRAGDVELGSLRLTAPARVDAVAAGTPGTVRVEPSWDDGAIALTLHLPSDTLLSLGPFERVGGGGYSVLSRNAQTQLDVRGVYRATVRDAGGVGVGWWEVKLAWPFAPRLFQGTLPGVSPVVAAGVVLALSSEVDWIEDHTLDVHRGTSNRGWGGLDAR